jgi:hypothetical protein
VTVVISLVAIVVALRLVESFGGLEIDSWTAAFGAALVVFFGEWGTGFLIAVLPSSVDGRVPLFWITVVVEGLSTLGLLLLAWAVVPGFHIRTIIGAVAAALFAIGIRYASTLLLAGVLAV